MTVSKRLRYEILRRDNHACRYCGGAAPDVALTVDHVVPTTLGGSDEPANLVAACVDCNAGKAASSPDAPLVEQVNDDVLRWRDAIRIVASVDLGHRDRRDFYREHFHTAWTRWTYESGGRRACFDLPLEWPHSIDRFVAAGLYSGDLDEAVDQAMRRPGVRDVFRYFCGVCWCMVTQRQQAALAYLKENQELADHGS